jgi:YD repeat-containing protein
LIDGFKNGTVNGTNEYTYSADGSLIRDNNKGIDTIAYNSLGKPKRIKFTDGRVVAYTYATDGSKLKMAVTVTGVTTTTDYVGGFVYTNNALSFFGRGKSSEKWQRVRVSVRD